MANRLAKAVHYLFQCGKDLVSETLCAKFAPNLLNRIHFGRIGWNVQNRHVFRHFQLAGLVPCRSVADDHQNIVSKFIMQAVQKNLHAFCVTIWNHQKETFTRHRLNCTINIAIFANMVAWNARTLTFFAPATLCFVNTSKSCFVLKY